MIFQIILRPSIKRAWAFYSIRNPEKQSEVLMTGVTSFSKLFNFVDISQLVNFDESQELLLSVESAHALRYEAMNAQSEFCKALGYFPRLNLAKAQKEGCPVYCIETGQVWQNATECARANNISNGRLSNHLNKVVGNRSIHGKTYSRITYQDAGGFEQVRTGFLKNNS